MLSYARTETESIAEKVIVLGRSKVANKSYFCPTSTCLADELSARSTSSFSNVWLVTDEDMGSSWLMVAEKPSCPHCAATLITTESERFELVLPLM
jgi:hypothetical protein